MGPMTVEQAAAAGPLQCQMKEIDSPTTCYECDEPNHPTQDCLLWHKPIQKAGTIFNSSAIYHATLRSPKMSLWSFLVLLFFLVEFGQPEHSAPSVSV